jgi:sialate O-acetylesterase
MERGRLNFVRRPPMMTAGIDPWSGHHGGSPGRRPKTQPEELRMRWNLLLACAGLALVASPVRATVQPHALCSEGMVLQQKADVHIWGKADPGEEVTVTFRDQKATTKANDKGDWLVTIKSGAAGGPEPMTIAGKNTLQYKNVLVGEVWVCSGQSNMEMAVHSCDKGDKDYAFSAPHNPMLRYFHARKSPMARPQTETMGRWIEADPKVIGPWTAVGYFFGRDLQKHLQVPVGLIQSDWGGTRAEAWTSPEALAASPRYQAEIANFQKATEGKSPHVQDANAPSALYNGMISPLLNYRIKGVIWYQGESNAGQAYAYRELFPLMIRDWRKHWHEGEFPFYFVQLAPFTSVRPEPGESAWAELREAQLLTLKELPHTGMAVIVDYGNEYDIHPTPKRPIGERLARIARAKDYGEKVAYSGPMYKDMKVEGKKAVLHFTHTNGGLVAKELVRTLERKDKNGQVHGAWRVKEGSTGASLVGFTVCGQDHKFYPAGAKIEGDTVVVSSDKVADPMAVRYGWADHPVCNLFNGAGLPASPFRTDDFRGITAPRQ